MSEQPVISAGLREAAVRPAGRTRQINPLLDRQRSFSSVLGREAAGTGPSAASPEEKARAAAEQLVAVTFIQPLLKQMRETSRAAPPFAPTQAERQFGALADAELAQQITRAAHFPLVDRLARDLLKGSGMERAREVLASSSIRAEDAGTNGLGVTNLASRH